MTRCLILLGVMLFALPLHAADSERGKSLYALCASCHGAAGEGNPALNAPALAGQDGAYLARQLEHFRDGVRGNDARDALGRQMVGMAASLTDAAKIADIVAYMGTFPEPPSPAAIDFNARNGENQYNAACGACHGAAAQGNAALHAPRLSTLDEVYLRRQYRNFGEGIRGSHPDDKYGRQMQMMATMLRTQQDLDDVIGFILAQ